LKLFAGAAALGLCLIALTVFLALRGHGPAAFPGGEWPDRAAAQSGGAFAEAAGGWLPAQIPEGATALRENHNLSTHQTWGSFRLPASSAASWVPARAARTPPGELMLLGAPRNLAWWPELLRGRVGSSDLEKQGFRFFFVEQGEPSPLVFGVRGEEVWFWRLARQ
jgi:hypothetical protein